MQWLQVRGHGRSPLVFQLSPGGSHGHGCPGCPNRDLRGLIHAWQRQRRLRLRLSLGRLEPFASSFQSIRKLMLMHDIFPFAFAKLFVASYIIVVIGGQRTSLYDNL